MFPEKQPGEIGCKCYCQLRTCIVLTLMVLCNIANVLLQVLALTMPGVKEIAASVAIGLSFIF